MVETTITCEASVQVFDPATSPAGFKRINYRPVNAETAMLFTSDVMNIVYTPFPLAVNGEPLAATFTSLPRLARELHHLSLPRRNIHGELHVLCMTN